MMSSTVGIVIVATGGGLEGAGGGVGAGLAEGGAGKRVARAPPSRS